MRVAAVQPPSFSGAEEWRNAEQACAFLDEAAAAGAEYVVFPEGYPGPYSGPMTNDALERVRRHAAARRLWVSAGRLIPGPLPDTYHITHVLIDDSGEIRAVYRRVQPNHPIFNAYLMGGRHHVLPGDELMTVDAPFGRIGLLICSELFVPELSRILMLRGADLVVAPGGGVHGPIRTRLADTWRAVARARAAENLLYVVVTQNLFAGARQGRTCIASPERMLAQRDDAGLVVADLDMTRLDALRSRYYDEEILSPPRSETEVFGCRPGQCHDRRPELYGELVAPQPDAFTYHYERRGLDTWRDEYEKIKEPGHGR
ncbi:MAG TPA: carbon-nitrogen hydrolase family protein [Thermodesulfobacteriota bacterium]|nr:carbon-nitrogen hydrolase family protein [Thermodesulfobacteriota bacterium]